MELGKKELTYRGKKLEELKQMNIREFARLLKANERRTVLRQTDELERFMAKANKKIERKKLIRTHLRHLVIIPRMVDMTINVYNGKEFSPVKIMLEMLGHRLGEFSLTRLKVKHGAAGIGATRSSASLSVK
ncbi:MAG: 30S ribosomal protein S19 [Candidatus Nanoarchaeia archaeon]|nr:30S ribosomal protein S19 [Candidatus Nanoarchaeia archaeon]MDD5741716.1 30S ribosomal protein S19 [Candidatus Nanoarchaeia archaeon]